jgi:hypothetical protein
MLFWLWKLYVYTLLTLCQIGWTRTPNADGQWMNCKPWDEEPWLSRMLLFDLISRNLSYYNFNHLINTDSYFQLRLQYWWGNTTIFVPDSQGQEWKDLSFQTSKVDEGLCKVYPERCPRIDPFLRHHMVTRSIPEGMKVKTMAGNKVWWSQVGGDRYLFPGGIKILECEAAWNGEIWKIERPLWPQSREH